MPLVISKGVIFTNDYLEFLIKNWIEFELLSFDLPIMSFFY